MLLQICKIIFSPTNNVTRLLAISHYMHGKTDLILLMPCDIRNQSLNNMCLLFQVQDMLHICTDHYEQEETKFSSKDKKDKEKKEEKEKEEKEVDLSSQQAIAVLGI